MRMLHAAPAMLFHETATSDKPHQQQQSHQRGEAAAKDVVGGEEGGSGEGVRVTYVHHGNVDREPSQQGAAAGSGEVQLAVTADGVTHEHGGSPSDSLPSGQASLQDDQPTPLLQTPSQQLGQEQQVGDTPMRRSLTPVQV